MSRRGAAALATVVGFVLFGCSTGVQRQPLESSVKPRSFNEFLEEARRNAEVRRQLVLEAEGHLAEGITSLLVFGDGVAVLNGVRQFRVPDNSVVALVELLITRGVASWPEESSVPEGNALEIHRRLLISIGEASHRVIERNKRPARPSLQRLLQDVAELVRPFSAAGVEVTSLAEGLRMVADGTLAPHVLTVNALAPGTPGAEEGALGGWQLTLYRNLLGVSSYSLKDGVRPLSRRPLPAAEVAALAQTLAEGDAALFPAQVHVERGHFQLVVELLGRRMSVQARQFAGQGAAAGAEARGKLEALRGQLYELFARETGKR